MRQFVKLSAEFSFIVSIFLDKNKDIDTRIVLLFDCLAVFCYITMDIEFDDNGWAAIHHAIAAEKELLMSIEKYVASNEEYLEVETKDELQRTPLLLAVERNKLKSVEKLIELGRLK